MASLRELFEQMAAALPVGQWGLALAQIGEQLRGLHPDS
jgi:hypothetical protein